MAAKICTPPKEIGDAPEIKHPFIFDEYQKANDAYVAKVQEYAKKHGISDCAGEIISFPAGDGCAQYVVFALKPLTTMARADGWQDSAAAFYFREAASMSSRRTSASGSSSFV